MRKKVSILIKGIIIGFVCTGIPGISSATIAVLLGIYQLMITSISDVVSDFKQSIKILLFLASGFLIGSAIGALSFTYLYAKFPIVFVLLVIGLLLGGIPKHLHELKSGLKKPTCWLVLILTLTITILCTYLLPIGTMIDFTKLDSVDYILLFLAGALTSITIAIPGVDYAILLLALGYYQPLINVLAELILWQNVRQNVGILIIYGLGYLLGMTIFAKIIKKINQKFPRQMQYASFTYVLIAPFLLVRSCVVYNANFNYNYLQVGLGLILALLAYFFIYNLPKILSHVEKEEDDNLIADSIAVSDEMFSRRIKRIPPRVTKVILFNLNVLFQLLASAKHYGKEKYDFQTRYKVMVKYVDIFHDLAKVEVIREGIERLPVDLGGCCFMGNHQGMDDCLAAVSALREYPTSFLINSNRADNFLVDKVCTLVDAERIDVKNIRSQFKTYDNMAEKIKAGRRYIIFPEAWYRDNKNTLLEFHSPCFIPAIKTKCPIIPFCLYDSWRVFEDTGTAPLKVYCYILEPIYYEEYQNLSKKELALLVKERIQKQLDAIKSENEAIKSGQKGGIDEISL